MVNKKLLKISMISLFAMSFSFYLESDSLATGRRSKTTNRSRSSRAALVSIKSASVTTVGSVVSEDEDEKNCKYTYMDCMDLLVPYIVKKTEFLKKDKTASSMINSDNNLRCVFDDSEVDENATIIEDVANSSSSSYSSFIKVNSSKSASSVSKLSRMAALYRNYNYYCEEGSEQGSADCDFSNSKSANRYAGEDSAAYYLALENQIDSGNLNLANFGDGIMKDLGIDLGGDAKKLAKDANGNDTTYGFAITASPPSFALDPAGEFALADSMCASGNTVKEFKRKKMLTKILGTSGLETLAEYSAILDSDECASSSMRSNVQSYYKQGVWSYNSEEEYCEEKRGEWDEDEELCSLDDKESEDYDGTYKYSSKPIVDENFMTPKKSCNQYEIALQSHRIEAKTSVQAMLTSRAKEIERSTKMASINELNADAEINVEIGQLLDTYITPCLDKFNDCMVGICGKGSVSRADYSGCVDPNGIKGEKLYSGGLKCYPAFNACAVNLEKTWAENGDNPYLKEMLQHIDAEVYQDRAIDTVSVNVGQAYQDLLELSCVGSGGFYENNFCFVKAVFKSRVKEVDTSKNVWRKDEDIDAGRIKNEYFVMPGADLSCKNSKKKTTENKSGWGKFFGKKSISTTTRRVNKIALIKNDGDGGELDEVDGCGDLFMPQDWSNYFSYLYSDASTYLLGDSKVDLFSSGVVDIKSNIPVCSLDSEDEEGDFCTETEERIGFTKDLNNFVFYDNSGEELTPKSYMQEKATAIMKGSDSEAGWMSIFK